MPDIITNCPDCNISFRALPSQLSAASGLVRCGTCLLVFKAQDHLQQPEDTGSNVEYMPYVLDGFSDLPEDAEYEIEGELSRDLDKQIGDELESLSYDNMPAELSEEAQSMLFDDVLSSTEGQKKSTSKLLSGFFTVVILAGGSLLLAAQAVHFNSADLSLNPEYRRLVQKFCAYTGCPINEYRDLSKIEISQFVVQDHPQHYGALSVDLLINNKAGYEQRFPRLFIQFNDFNDAPVAQRSFTASEYLRGRLADAIIMPRNQKIHINLELVNPGDNATSYAIELID